MSNNVSTVPVLHFEFDRPRGQLSTVLDKLPVFMRSRLNVNGDTMHADLGTLKDLVNDPTVGEYNIIKALKWELCRRYPEFMGQCDPNLSEDFLNTYRGKFTILEVYRRDIDPPLSNGYHKLACLEPLILEPDDWSRDDWRTLCKLCGLDPWTSTRIVLNLKSMETFIERESEQTQTTEGGVDTHE